MMLNQRWTFKRFLTSLINFKDKDTTKKKNAEIWIGPLFSFKNSYFYKCILVIKLYIKNNFEKFFSLIIISENIKISMLQKDKTTYEFIK